MATTASLSTLRSRALDFADLTNSSSPVTARLTEYVNDAVTELHDILINSFEEYYRTTSTITIVSGTESYALPTDFYKAIKVFALSGGNRYRLSKFLLDEVDVHSNEFTPNVRELTNLTYRIMGGNIWFAPVPSSGGSVELWYYPQADVLANDGDTMTVYAPVSWWSEFVGLSAAIKLRVREESDASQLMALFAACKQRIKTAAEERDAAEPNRIADKSFRFVRHRARQLYR